MLLECSIEANDVVHSTQTLCCTLFISVQHLMLLECSTEANDVVHSTQTLCCTLFISPQDLVQPECSIQRLMIWTAVRLAGCMWGCQYLQKHDSHALCFVTCMGHVRMSV